MRIRNLLPGVPPVLFQVAMPALVNAQDIGADWRGDRLSVPFDVEAKVLPIDGISQSSSTVCIPAKTALRGVSRFDDKKGVDVTVISTFGTPESCADDRSKLPANKRLRLKPDLFIEGVISRYGLTYGLLVVPFKYQLSGDKGISGGGSVAPYLGYRFDENDIGLGVRLVGFAGASAISSDPDASTGESVELAGLSYGLGVIGTVKDSFQIGIVVGADKVDSEANYKNNGKPWLAVSIGFDFAQ